MDNKADFVCPDCGGAGNKPRSLAGNAGVLLSPCNTCRGSGRVAEAPSGTEQQSVSQIDEPNGFVGCLEQIVLFALALFGIWLLLQLGTGRLFGPKEDKEHPWEYKAPERPRLPHR